MRSKPTATISDLREAVDCLPHDTKVAMLEGIRRNEIIVGAYSAGDGVCPMLAAHRAGGRTSFVTFARAWDRFAFRGSRVRRARRATERELLILTAQLEASLLDAEDPAPELAAAIEEHRLLAERSRRRDRDASRGEPLRRLRPGDPDRAGELRHRPGWRWMRVVRRYDDYERALARLRSERDLPNHRELVRD
jgi:hypothetical protein